MAPRVSVNSIKFHLFGLHEESQGLSQVHYVDISHSRYHADMAAKIRWSIEVKFKIRLSMMGVCKDIYVSVLSCQREMN